MAKPQVLYSAQARGREVVLQVGIRTLTMEYDAALKMAAMLFQAGKDAKRQAGDSAPMIFGLGTLSDANADEMKAQKQRDGTIQVFR